MKRNCHLEFAGTCLKSFRLLSTGLATMLESGPLSVAKVCLSTVMKAKHREDASTALISKKGVESDLPHGRPVGHDTSHLTISRLGGRLLSLGAHVGPLRSLWTGTMITPWFSARPARGYWAVRLRESFCDRRWSALRSPRTTRNSFHFALRHASPTLVNCVSWNQSHG